MTQLSRFRPFATLAPLVVAVLVFSTTPLDINWGADVVTFGQWIAWLEVAAIWSAIGPGTWIQRQLFGWAAALCISLLFVIGDLPMHLPLRYGPYYDHNLRSARWIFLNWVPLIFVGQQISVRCMACILGWRLEAPQGPNLPSIHGSSVCKSYSAG